MSLHPQIPPELESSIQLIWDFHRLSMTIGSADGMIVLGSSDLRVPVRAAEIYLQGGVPWILFSGKEGWGTRGTWTEPEAVVFGRIAQGHGVPASVCHYEVASQNTGENIRFCRTFLEREGTTVRNLIVVTKSFMERRVLLTVEKFWPELQWQITSPNLTLAELLATAKDWRRCVEFMVGDLHRIMVYPARGYQTPCAVPPQVLEAFDRLVAAGFTGHLVP